MVALYFSWCCVSLVNQALPVSTFSNREGLVYEANIMYKFIALTVLYLDDHYQNVALLFSSLCRWAMCGTLLDLLVVF